MTFHPFYSFSKLRYQFENTPNINAIILVIILVLIALVMGFLNLFRRTTEKLFDANNEIEKLQKISANQEIINMGQKNLIDRLNDEGQIKNISKSRWVVFLEEYNKINPYFNKNIVKYNLTKGEMRLAILLASQLNFHEIATLFSVNVETM